MGSSAAYAKPLAAIAKPVLLPASIAAIAYGAYHGRKDIVEFALKFFTGPGNKSRIFALVMAVVNWKSLPLMWTVRVWNAMISHILVRKHHSHGPDKLFHAAVSETHVSLMEVDYNVHKSNSTYFADLDVSRSHLVSHLFASGVLKMHDNRRTRLVMDPRDPTRPAKGLFNVMLGAVECSFKREIKPYQRYEMWSRVLSWDRKWMYIVTYFVEAGAVRPRSWDLPGRGQRVRDTAAVPADWEKKVFATAVSKYVFKIGRLTVHPAVLIGASGLLPERPGGWVTLEASGESTPVELVVSENGEATANGHANGEAKPEEAEWDWRKTEAMRLKGMEFAAHFAALDDLSTQFDGGEDGAIHKFTLG